MFPMALPLLWWTVRFSLLIQMSLCSFNCLGLVLLDAVFSQHQPAHIVARFDGFEPS